MRWKTVFHKAGIKPEQLGLRPVRPVKAGRKILNAKISLLADDSAVSLNLTVKIIAYRHGKPEDLAVILIHLVLKSVQVNILK